MRTAIHLLLTYLPLVLQSALTYQHIMTIIGNYLYHNSKVMKPEVKRHYQLGLPFLNSEMVWRRVRRCRAGWRQHRDDWCKWRPVGSSSNVVNNAALQLDMQHVVLVDNIQQTTLQLLHFYLHMSSTCFCCLDTQHTSQHSLHQLNTMQMMHGNECNIQI